MLSILQTIIAILESGEDELGCTDECGDGDKFFCRTEPVIGGSECIDQVHLYYVHNC